MAERPKMRAVLFDGSLKFVRDYPVPEIPEGWARIRVRIAGICKTDLEIIKGYKGFHGVLGHEFIGTVEKCKDLNFLGKNVVGEINASCGSCEWCEKELGRHCPNRSVLGISGLDGCMADYCILPISNLMEIPPTLSDNRAILIEPLSAACEILEQVRFDGSERAVVLGDGRLGILCAWVLSTVLPDVTLVGHHTEKLQLAEWRHIKTAHGIKEAAADADVVVEATGTGAGIMDAMSLCKPRGTIVLKSTVVCQGELNLAAVVVNELTVLGSRCGRFVDGLNMLTSFMDMPIERLISSQYPIEKALAAFEQAALPQTLKVLLSVSY